MTKKKGLVEISYFVIGEEMVLNGLLYKQAQGMEEERRGYGLQVRALREVWSSNGSGRMSGPTGIGFDASIGFLARSYDAINHKIGFDVSDLKGYGSAWSGAVWVVDGTYGGNLDSRDWNPWNFGATYLSTGAGASFGGALGLTFSTTYTWTFWTSGKN